MVRSLRRGAVSDRERSSVVALLAFWHRRRLPGRGARRGPRIRLFGCGSACAERCGESPGACSQGRRIQIAFVCIDIKSPRPRAERINGVAQRTAARVHRLVSAPAPKRARFKTHVHRLGQRISQTARREESHFVVHRGRVRRRVGDGIGRRFQRGFGPPFGPAGRTWPGRPTRRGAANRPAPASNRR